MLKKYSFLNKYVFDLNTIGGPTGAAYAAPDISIVLHDFFFIS